MMGGTTDFGSGGFNVQAPAVQAPNFDEFDPFGAATDSRATDWGRSFDASMLGGQGSDWAGSMGLGGPDTGPAPSFFDPASVGPPPPPGPSFDPGGFTIAPTSNPFQVAPNQGSSVVGSFGAGAGDVTMGGGPAPADEVPATAWESQAAPWWRSADSSRADVLRSGRDSLAYSATPGMVGRVDPAASVASSSAGPGPSFGNKLGAWGRQTGTSLANAPGRAADTFARAPIATTAKLASTVGPLIIAGINASRQADAARRAERQAQQSGQVLSSPVNPLPGTSGISRASIPAASPMSPLMGAGPAGGFRVQPNVGLPRQPQPLATGGSVGEVADYSLGLRAGGPVEDRPAQGLYTGGRVDSILGDSIATYEPWARGGEVGSTMSPTGQPGNHAQAEAIMAYLARLLAQPGR